MKITAKNTRGFTLIELVIAMAIVAIIAAIAIPAYDKYQKKGYRTDAMVSLTRIAQLQERWKSINGSYTNDINDVGGAASDQGRYTLALSNITAETYTITATPTGGQANDTQCASMSLDHVGRKTAVDSSATDTSKKCWPR